MFGADLNFLAPSRYDACGSESYSIVMGDRPPGRSFFCLKLVLQQVPGSIQLLPPSASCGNAWPTKPSVVTA
jgi:hypothetical protein